jgi:two-component SAPR family response regulator
LSAVILVIDEDLNLRLSIAQILRQAGNVVFLAETRLEALDLLKVLHVDLVFLDIKLRTSSENTFIKTIREICPDIPLLIMNAYAQADSPVRGLLNADVRYLAKPVDPPAILETIGNMLG